MRNTVFSLLVGFSALAFLPINPAIAAELLDVKPVVTGSNVVVEVTADIPMTYTYYKVPGQARAVVDIADADPEKVEPLIVVNSGAVASISVDKAMIGDMTVSRLIFNLVSESEIAATLSPDRKKLIVSFGGGKPVIATTPATPAPTPAQVPVVSAPVEPIAPTVSAAAPSISPSKEEEDPLGLDDPKPAAAPAKEAAPAVVRSTKLEPVVPASVDQTAPALSVVKGVIVGASFVEIQTTAPVGKFKQLRLSKPERLSIDIPGTSSMGVRTIQVKRFGVSNVRIGTTPGFVRVVLDTTKPYFPKYEIVTIEKGLRINFK